MHQLRSWLQNLRAKSYTLRLNSQKKCFGGVTFWIGGGIFLIEMLINPTDIELIRDVLQNDNARAFETLMKRYTSSVYGAALRLMKDEENAQEVTQMAFIQAYRQLDSWRGENFGAWVTIIANHIALRMLEKEKRRQTDPLDENTDPPNEEYDEQKELQLQAMEAAIAQLPEADRQIIQWHYYENLPLQTIAQQLGQTENNIKVRMFRIRERIKRKSVRCTV